MKRDVDTDPEELDRPDGNDLQTNYDAHDVAEEEVLSLLRVNGLDVEPWGIDMRDDDGDGIVYDDKMDFKVYDGDELVGLLDVKAKRSPRYMGRYNLRHHEHYREHAQSHDVPVFVVMCQISENPDRVHDNFAFEISGNGDIGHGVLPSTQSEAVNRFPDGNDAVLVPHFLREGYEYMLHRFGVEGYE